MNFSKLDLKVLCDMISWYIRKNPQVDQDAKNLIKKILVYRAKILLEDESNV